MSDYGPHYTGPLPDINRYGKALLVGVILGVLVSGVVVLIEVINV